MSAKFLENFSGKFAEQWVATLLTPAFVFWAGGFTVALQRWGWRPCLTGFAPCPNPSKSPACLAFLSRSQSPSSSANASISADSVS